LSKVNGQEPLELLNGSEREQAVDFLVMGSVGRTGIAKMVLGSVAAKVTGEMPCSVVTDGRGVELGINEFTSLR